MEISWNKLDVPGCYSGRLSAINDNRGSFQKLFNVNTFESVLPGFIPREIYLTNSLRGVLRGMHFQLPPDDHAKIVICLSGSALDVMIDLRPGKSYGAVDHVRLSPKAHNCVAMPSGIGHGFYAESENTQLLYLVETGYSPLSDTGILWQSIDFEWPNPTPILSERDKSHKTLDEFLPPDEWKNIT